ncbi:hypothetical protein UFOVP787_71 [uncultured Caudovirales phage]|uniref:Uncharacterized protein n=1 Tax=uncultured Caudovirales phage TaxID=2100421 RepID=A0A6J5NZL5_9CAUD|nr:hypothetical protein UFOVP787_71 [uncultured Caudovirales phage]
MFNLQKELSFLELTGHLLGFSDQKIAVMRELITEDQSEFSARLWEKTIAKLAKTKFTDVAHKDFSDGTESKTASTRRDVKGKIQGQISNVSGKTGWIRVACFNNYKNVIDFFLLPPDHDCKSYFSPANGDRGSIKFTYNRKEDTYSNYLEKYRVKNAKAACVQMRSLSRRKGA